MTQRKPSEKISEAIAALTYLTDGYNVDRAWAAIDPINRSDLPDEPWVHVSSLLLDEGEVTYTLGAILEMLYKALITQTACEDNDMPWLESKEA